MMATLVQAPKVTVGSSGASLHEYWARRLVSLSLEMQFQVPTRLTMRFATPVLGAAAPAFPFALDSQVDVTFPVEHGNAGATFSKPCGSLWVTEVGAEREGENHGEFVVVAHDASFRLTRRHRVYTYTERTASDIVKDIVSGAGLQPGTIDATGDALPYVLQSDTDFGFITTLARRHGFDWWVDGDVLHFCKPSSSPTTVPVSVTSDLIRFSVSTSAVASPSVVVNGWDRDRQETVSGTARPGSLPANEVPGTSDAKNGTPSATPLATASIRASTNNEAETLAKAIAANQAASAVSAQGELRGAPDVVPGVVIEVTGEHLGGSYHVTQVEHRFSAAGYITRFSAGDRRPTGLADLLSAGSTSDQMGTLAGLPALIPALVTQIGTGDNLGRVKVKIPFLSNEDESHWARVLSAGGGPERGFWFLPEVDDEVLVAFEGGDTRFPVVIGGLYGKVNTPENLLLEDGKIYSRSIKSRLGHYMGFIDGSQADARSITMGLGKDGAPGTDYMVRMGEDRFDIKVPEGKPIAIVAGKAQITFTDSSTIEVRADAITVKADNELNLEGKDVNVKGTATVNIEQGGNKVSLGTGGVAVKGAPSTSIKGSPQVAIG